MLVVDNGDAIRGIAEVASKLDFIVNGYVGTTATQLADGQLANTEGNLYQSGANATVVTSITIVNTDSAARTFTLYLKPSGGTSRAISPVSLDLGISHSFYTDGQQIVVMDAGGQILSTWAVDDTPVNGETDKPVSSNWAYDHANVADPHTGYVLESLFDAKGDGIFASADNTPAKVTVGTNNTVLTADSGQAAGVKWATVSGATVAVKPSDETVNDSATLQNDDDLFFAVSANEVWTATFYLYHSSGTTPDIKYAVTVPTNAVGYYLTSFHTDRVEHDDSPSKIAVLISAVLTIMHFLIIVGDTGGNAQLQFAQNSQNASDTKLLTGSCLVAHKVN